MQYSNHLYQVRRASLVDQEGELQDYGYIGIEQWVLVFKIKLFEYINYIDSDV